MSFSSEVKRIASGRTEPGATNWMQYPNGKGIFVDVDTSAGCFTDTPVYITSMGGRSCHWSTTGATSIYLESATGFRIYVRWADGNDLTPAQANDWGWHISWIGTEI